MSAPSPFVPARPDSAGRTDVLLVDDDARLAASLSQLLRRCGYVAASVGQGREALEFLASHPVALVVSDIFMPDCDGLELLRALRPCTSRPRLVVMSGSNALHVPGMLGAAQMLGADRTIAKPFDPAQLLDLVREMIGPPVSPPPPAALSDPAVS